MPITRLTPEGNYPYLDERIRALAKAVPEAVADGKINWEKLRETLGDYLEEEDASEEHFGLSWPGKREARKLASQPSRGTLIPVPGEGVNEDTTENIFIEGENLEVMKLMLKSYAGRIKMIYIDPPYNTGNDFIYNDKFADPLEAYLEYTGAKGESGELLTTNTRADGRFHSKWMNMMYPRLIIAKELLCDDGVIFVSIDDNEAHNLFHLLVEVFGEENFIADIVVINNLKGRNDKAHIATANERLIIFKSPTFLERGLSISKKSIQEYKHTDKNGNKYRLLGLRKRGGADTRELRPNLYYPIYIDANTGEISTKQNNELIEVYPQKSDHTDGAWRWGKNRVELKKDILVGIKKATGKWDVFQKDYLFHDGKEKRIKPKSVWFGSDVSTDNATKNFKKLMGETGFQNPKPIQFIENIIEYSMEENDIILDFFAGSGSTGHAIFNKSIQEHIKRNFILIQIPEKIIDGKYEYITEISKERLRRGITNIRKSPNLLGESKTFISDNTLNIDLGFKVYKLVNSNFKMWQEKDATEVDSVETLFNNSINPLTDNWKPSDLLTEILLLEGFPLTSKVVIQDEYMKNQIYLVSAPDFCAHNLVVCLDETVYDSTVSKLTIEEKDVLICLDSALTDEGKARLKDRFNVHVI